MDEVRVEADSTRSDNREGDTGKTLTNILSANVDKAEKVVAEHKEKKRKERVKQPEEPEASKELPDDNDGTPSVDGKQAKSQLKGTEERQPTAKPNGGAGGAKSPKESADQPFAPKTWTEEERQAFESAPLEVQSAINKLVKNLQGGFTKKTTEISEVRRVADEVASAFQPHHRAAMQQKGISEGQLLREYLALDDFYRSNPVGYVQHIIQQSGIRPEHLGLATNTQSQQNSTQQVEQSQDPGVARLQQELAAMKGVLTQAAQQSQARQQFEQQNRFNDASQSVTNFRNTVDESGVPLYPHFDAVWQSMMPHIAEMNADQSKNKLSHQEKLQAAYDRAVWANPDTRKALQEAERATLDAEYERQRSRSAISSRPRAGGGIIGQPNSKLKTLDDAISGAMRKHGI